MGRVPVGVFVGVSVRVEVGVRDAVGVEVLVPVGMREGVETGVFLRVGGMGVLVDVVAGPSTVTASMLVYVLPLALLTNWIV